MYKDGSSQKLSLSQKISTLARFCVHIDCLRRARFRAKKSQNPKFGKSALVSTQYGSGPAAAAEFNTPLFHEKTRLNLGEARELHTAEF